MKIQSTELKYVIELEGQYFQRGMIRPLKGHFTSLLLNATTFHTKQIAHENLEWLRQFIEESLPGMWKFCKIIPVEVTHSRELQINEDKQKI